MSQNTSSAVMQQRREPDDSLDDFPTPPWATRALYRHVLRPGEAFGGDPMRRTAWEPACNRGYMAQPLGEVFGLVHATDVFDYSTDPATLPSRPSSSGWSGQTRVCDFLGLDGVSPNIAANGVDWIVTNPPFRLAEQFIALAIDLAREGVAMFVRTGFLHGGQRHACLYSRTPPTIVAYFAERVILHKGVLRDPGRPYWDPKANDGEGGWKTPSTATDYVWLVWLKGRDPRPPVWIPPCRKALERPGDYPDPGPGPAPEAMTLLGGAG